MQRNPAAELIERVLAPLRQGGKCCLLGCMGAGILLLSICFCLVFLPLSLLFQKSEFVWPAGVTPLGGGGSRGIQDITPPADAEYPNYARYRSVGWEISSPYGWRTYMNEELTPIPGEYEFHDGIDLAGPGFGYHEPVYPLLDGQPFFIGFYPDYYSGAGEAVVIFNVHTIEEAPVKVLYGHLSAYQIEVETYCLDNDRYEPDIPIEIICPAQVAPEKGRPGDRTGPDGKAKFYNGTPGMCTARVLWPEGYEAHGPTEISFDQQIDEEHGIAYDALIRFYGCKPEPTPTPSPTITATATPTPPGSAGGGIGGPAAQAPTPTRLPSPTPGATRTPAPTATPAPPTMTPSPTPWGPPVIPTHTPTPGGPTHTPTRLPSPTPHPTGTPLPTETPPPPSQTPTRTPGPTRTPHPTHTPGPPRTAPPTWTPYPRPTIPTVPPPTEIPHECPIGQNLCYFPGFGPPITANSELKQGQTIIGYVGMSGRTTGPHLHLALYIYATGTVDVLVYERPTDEVGNPVPEERLHYYARWTEWLDPLQFLPQANAEMGLAYMDQPLQLPGPGPIISEAGEGVWFSPGDVYSRGGGGRILGWINEILCGWFGWLCP